MLGWCLVKILATCKLSVVRLVFDPGEKIFVYHIAIPVLVKHLQVPPCNSGSDDQKPYEHEVEEASAFALGLLAVKPEHPQLIVEAGALPLLVDILKRQKSGSNSRAVTGVI